MGSRLWLRLPLGYRGPVGEAELTVLLPPSEGKAVGGRPGRGGGSLHRYLGTRRAIVVEALAAELAGASAKRREAILQVRGELLDRALESSALVSAGRAPLLPAWRRYTGVVWASLQPATLSRAELARVLVPSGLYGLTSALDPVADYRLKMSVSLSGTGRLSAFWREALTGVVARRSAGGVVVNLLPAEHAAAFDLEQLAASCELREVRFLTRDGKAAAGHAAKAVKGALARALLLEGEPALAGFRHGGWRVRRAGDAVEVLAP